MVAIMSFSMSLAPSMSRQEIFQNTPSKILTGFIFFPIFKMPQPQYINLIA